MTDIQNNKNNATPVTTNTTTPATTPIAPATRVLGSIQTGVKTSDVKFKSILDLRRDFGDNWV